MPFRRIEPATNNDFCCQPSADRLHVTLSSKFCHNFSKVFVLRTSFLQNCHFLTSFNGRFLSKPKFKKAYLCIKKPIFSFASPLARISIRKHLYFSNLSCWMQSNPGPQFTLLTIKQTKWILYKIAQSPNIFLNTPFAFKCKEVFLRHFCTCIRIRFQKNENNQIYSLYYLFKQNFPQYTYQFWGTLAYGSIWNTTLLNYSCLKKICFVLLCRIKVSCSMLTFLHILVSFREINKNTVEDSKSANYIERNPGD